MAIPLSWYEETAAALGGVWPRRDAPVRRRLWSWAPGWEGWNGSGGGGDGSYEALPRMPHPAVGGHAGTLTCGRLSGQEVAVLSGRIHGYEGYTMEETAYAVGYCGCWACGPWC